MQTNWKVYNVTKAASYSTNKYASTNLNFSSDAVGMLLECCTVDVARLRHRPREYHGFVQY